jgi:hypothetical protein
MNPIVERYLKIIQRLPSTYNRLKEIERDRSGKIVRGLTNPQLVELHRKCHMLYGAWTKKGNVKKEAFEFIVKVHDELVEEMLRRGMRHNTPLEVPK